MKINGAGFIANEHGKMTSKLFEIKREAWIYIGTPDVIWENLRNATKLCYVTAVSTFFSTSIHLIIFWDDVINFLEEVNQNMELTFCNHNRKISVSLYQNFKFIMWFRT